MALEYREIKIAYPTEMKLVITHVRPIIESRRERFEP
jgi:hypothetical protein